MRSVIRLPAWLATTLVLLGFVVIATSTPASAVDPSQWVLTSYCTPAESYPDFRRFRVRNLTGVEQLVSLRNQNTGQTIQVPAAPGDSFHLVPAAPDPAASNTTQLIVDGVTVATKAANNKACSSLVGNATCAPGTGAFTVVWQMKNNDSGASQIIASSLPGLTFSPNPVPASATSNATESVVAPTSGTVVRTLTLTVDLGSGITSNPEASVTLGQCEGPPPPIIDFTFTKTPSVTNANVGDTVTYTYVGTNTGEVALEVTQLVDDRLGIVVQEPAVPLVQPGQSVSRDVSYVVADDDASLGSIDNAAVITVLPQSGPDLTPRTRTATALVTVNPIPAPPDALAGMAECDTSTGEFTVTWTLFHPGPGEAVVTSTAPRTLTFSPQPIPPGGEATATETVAAPASAPETLSLEVTVDAAPGDPTPRPTVTLVTELTLGQCEGPEPAVLAFTFTKSVDQTAPSAGTVLTYTYSGTNTGNVPIEVLQLVDDRLGVVIQEPAVTIVPPGESLTRSIQYTVTLQDASFGRIDNVAVVTVRDASVPDFAPVSAVAALNAVLVQAIPADVESATIGGGLAASGSPAAGKLGLVGVALVLLGACAVGTARRLERRAP